MALMILDLMYAENNPKKQELVELISNEIEEEKKKPKK